MRWRLSHRYDPPAVAIADRHYNRQTPGAPQFVPPGRCLVLLGPGALWVSSWQAHVRHAYPGAWVNSLFRNETREALSSELITEAVAATVWRWGPPPAVAYPFITFIDPDEIRSTNPGYCYLKAGWERIGVTCYAHLIVLGLRADRFPAAEPPAGAQYLLEVLA